MSSTVPNLVLYHSPVSTCSQKVRMALAEKELPWTDHVIIFSRGDHLTEEYLALNPNGVVPTLLHDDVPITDSSVINEYLEDVSCSTVEAGKASGSGANARLAAIH
jgi:glutathione S-transferase